MAGELDTVYMIVVKGNSIDEVFWHCTGRGFTPFTTTSLSRAKGELTRCSKFKGYTYQLVAVSDIQEVV